MSSTSISQFHRAAVNRSHFHERNFQPSKKKFTALACFACDVNSQVNLPTVVENSVCLSACAWTHLTSHSLQKINLFLMSVRSEQQNNSMFFSNSWKSSCTMFVLCKAALNESRRTAALWYPRAWYSPSVIAKQKGRGGIVRDWGHMHVWNFPQASVPNMNTDPVSIALLILFLYPPFRTANWPLFPPCQRSNLLSEKRLFQIIL